MELLVAMGIMAVIIPAIITAIISSREGFFSYEKIDKIEAQLKNTKEAILVIRDRGFEHIETNGIFHINEENGTFYLRPDKFTDANDITTEIVIESVLRDANQTIVSNGMYLDPSVKKITIKAYTSSNFKENKQLTLFLTRYLLNSSFSQDKTVEFENGTFNNTKLDSLPNEQITLKENVNEGSYESAPIDLGSKVVINSIMPKFITPINTAIKYQISVSKAVNNNCIESESFFTGPDGTPNSFYMGTQMVVYDTDNALYENPERCFRYKAFLSTETINISPILDAFHVNFSP